MGILSHLFYPWGLILQGLAIVHFIRRRPDTYWIYVILFLGPIGATIYLFAEALPDIGLARHSLQRLLPPQAHRTTSNSHPRQPFDRELRRTWRPLSRRRQTPAGAGCLRQSHCRPRQHTRSVLRTRPLRHPVRRCRRRQCPISNELSRRIPATIFIAPPGYSLTPTR